MADFPTLAGILNAHRWRGTTLGCECHGWTWAEPLTHFCGEEERIERAHADHVAAEWVKARTVETVEQLDALPEGAVIHVPHKVTASSVEHRHGRWWPSRSTGPYHHGFRDELLPARLLWHPERDS
ncbi:hypothetical protein M2272_005892 [Mycobacterium frederiksbergense]|uniref:Uncharacterized protein n=1 Tax=Mycolicibacterium frederiksbergense TaxID=117567 RepID=A0ABT6L8G6_9MYCO|nr:hypothetical protein [Mycolicibacterium frederiksbergense]MDH6199224.1 hypothetical protein [Mycolicibacterium frederiksbergense]